MMEKYSKRFGVDSFKKAALNSVPAFFLLLLSTTPAFASINKVGGVAFGTDSDIWETAPSINSISNGFGVASIGYSGTTNLTISHGLEGYITITNDFDQFTVTGVSGSISNAFEIPLLVSGGTNLLINGGSYVGLGYEKGYDLPPIPGRPSMSNIFATAAAGALITGTENVHIHGADFSGGTYTSNNISMGLSGLQVDSVNLTISGTNSFTGSAAVSRSASGAANAISTGGTALYAENSSVIISNGTFTGGNAGNTTANGSGNAASIGGNAVNVWSNSTLEIHGGTFSGGTAGQAIAENGIAVSLNGYAVVIGNNSTGTVHGGTFKGGGTAASFAVLDSTLSVHDGDLASGIYSETTDGTNTLNLLGGSIGAVELWNATNGFQLVTVNSNATFSKTMTLFGGSAFIDNQVSNKLQKLSVYSGSMELQNGLTLNSGGSIITISPDALLSLPSLDARSGSHVSAGMGLVNIDGGNYTAGTGSTLDIYVVSNYTGLITANTVNFESNSIVSVDATETTFSAGTHTITNITTDSGIQVNGTTVSEGLFESNVVVDVTLTENTNVVGRTLLSNILFDDPTKMILLFDTKSLVDYWNADGQLADLADDLDYVNDPAMMKIIDELGAEASSEAVDETYFTGFNTFQTALLGLRASVAQSISRGTEFRETLSLPKGSKGPDSPDNDWRIWAKYYGQFYSRDANGSEQGFESVIHGGVFGMDKSFEQLLIGLATGMGRYKSDYDNDFEEDLSAVQAMLYTTWGREHAYIDAGLAYGFNDVETTTADPFILNGDFDTHLISGYLNGGYGIEAEKLKTVFTPEAGLQYTIYQQDAYTESSSTAAPRSFEEFDSDSLQSTLGLNVAMVEKKKIDTFTFKAEGRLHWLHEFNPEPGNMQFSLQGGNGTDYIISYPLLDEDAVRIGIGLSFFNNTKRKPDNIMLRLDFDELIGENFNSHNLAAKVIYAF